MTEKLKPCPFCGGDAKVLPGSGIFNDQMLWVAICVECKAKSRDFWTQDEAIAAWNRRADEKEGL